MKNSLSIKWFLCLLFAVAVFCVAQVFVMLWIEIAELIKGKEFLIKEITDISFLFSISSCVFVLMLGCFLFVFKRIIRPIRIIAESANRISEGSLMERIEGDFTGEVGMLAFALNSAFDRYNESVNSLDRFVGNTAHQLRTPLTSILSIAEVCLQQKRNSHEYIECIENIIEVTRELTNMTEKLLMIARLNPSRIRQNFVPVNLTEIVSKVIELYLPVVLENKIRFTKNLTRHITIMGDIALIRQAVGNIMDNAVHFTPEGGTLTVTLKKEKEYSVLSVSDSGPGIPDNIRSFLIQEQNKIPYSDEMQIGRLGLTIASQILRIHQGEIKIDINKYGGSCVELFIPSVDSDISTVYSNTTPHYKS